MLLLAACVLRVRAGDRSIRLLLWSLLPLMVLALWRVGEVLAGRALNPTMSMLFTISFLFLGMILFIGLVERMLQYKRERDAADSLARHDPLTAAYNRRALDERLQAAELESRRADRPLALLFADIITRPLGGENLMALASRLMAIWLTARWSHMTLGTLGSTSMST